MQRTTILAVCVRVLLALLTRTFFQPDEYFQALEPAHQAVFGYGHLTWEWLADRPIRSPIYAALNIPVYWLLKITGIHHHWPSLLITGPKVLHGILAALTDVSVCRLAAQVVGQRYVYTTLFLSLTSFFHSLALSRSLGNSLETSLTTIALTCYPWDTLIHKASPWNPRRFKIFLLVVAFACAIRPTNAIIWIYMFTALVLTIWSDPETLASAAINTGIVGILALGFVFGIDTIYFSKATLTPLNFAMTNLSSVSLFYGSSSWHYYLLQALPILCTTSLPFVLHGVWGVISDSSADATNQKLRTLLGCVGWTLALYSMAGHKEWRFIHPLLPILHIFASKSLVDSYHRGLLVSNPTKTQPSGDRTERRLVLPIRTAHMWLVFLTIPASIYVVFFHSSAQITVMHFLRGIPRDEARSIGFLMPCHSTPWQAYLHRSDLQDIGKLWALGCEPPLGGQNAAVYKDQTDIFYDAPTVYIQRNFPSVVNTTFPPSPYPSSLPGTAVQVVDGSAGPWKHEWPELFIMFGILLEDESVRLLLDSRGYSEIWSAGQRWEGEGKRRGGVKVWKYLG